MPLKTGDRIGNYEVTSLLGKGGMGEVFRARDTKLGREVAIKVLPEAFASPERLLRFEREAKVLAALNHPNIATIYTVEESADGKALVMELVPGEPLKGPVPLDTALKYAAQIASALDAAHEKGITHRDLKPGNIMLTPQGVIKVLDFGLASVTQPSGQTEDGATLPTLSMSPTQSGAILGTAAYMSPEQARGETVDQRADIWAFGVVLHELLTGRRLFDGKKIADVLASVLRDRPDMSAIPVRVRRLIAGCLEKEPDQRLSTIRDWRLLLSDETEAAPVAAPVQSRPIGLIALAVAFAAIAIVLGVIHFREKPPEAKVMRFEIHAPPGSTLPLGTPAPSPDGSMIAFTVRDPDGKTRIHVRPIDRLETRALQGTEDTVHPFWSPDSKALAFATSTRELKRIDLTGGAPRLLVGDVNGPWHGDWSSKGDILFARLGGVNRVSASSGGNVDLVAPNRGHATWLSDGQRFLTRRNGGKSGIDLAILGSKDLIPVLPDVDSAPLFAATPVGTYLLYLRTDDLVAQPFDVNSGKLTGEPVLVVTGIGRVANPPIKAAAGVSPTGVLAYQTGSRTSGSEQLSWLDRKGQIVGTLPVEASGRNPRLSPDGKSILVDRSSPDGSNVWMVDLVRNTATRVSFVNSTTGVWSPDGKRIAFSNRAEESIQILNGADLSRVRSLPNLRVYSWSPDGKFLTGIVASGNEVLIPLEGDSKPIPLGLGNGRTSEAVVSPAGKLVAYVSDESGQAEVYLREMPPATGRWRVSGKGGGRPRWRGDGRELFFLTQNELMEVDVSTVPTVSLGVPKELFPLPTLSSGEYSVRADGQQFLFNFDPSMGVAGKDDHPITVVLNWWLDLKK